MEKLSFVQKTHNDSHSNERIPNDEAPFLPFQKCMLTLFFQSINTSRKLLLVLIKAISHKYYRTVIYNRNKIPDYKLGILENHYSTLTPLVRIQEKLKEVFFNYLLELTRLKNIHYPDYCHKIRILIK